MGVPFFSYEQGSPADLSWQAILRAFFEDPWAGATVVTANSASAVPIRIVRFILCSLLPFFSKSRTFFSVAVQTRRREYQSQIRSTTTAGENSASIEPGKGARDGGFVPRRRAHHVR